MALGSHGAIRLYQAIRYPMGGIVAPGRSAPKRTGHASTILELEALQGTTAKAEGEQGGEQTEPDDRTIAQIDFHTPHRLEQKFAIQIHVEGTRRQHQNGPDKPQAEHHIEYPSRAGRGLR